LNEKKGLTTDAIKFYLAAADSLAKGGLKEKLLAIYEKIIALSPSNIPLRNKVAEIYIKEGLQAEAGMQYLHIARIYSEKADIEKSIEFYQKVLSLQPLNREAILELNSQFEKKGDLNQALGQMREAAHLFPQDPDILFRCAGLHMEVGRFDEAEEYLRMVTEMEPANIRARRLLGDIYRKTGDKEKAWSEYLPVLDEMLLDEDYDAAIEILTSFKDIDPIETGKRLVSLYTQLNDSPSVVRELISLGDVFSENKRQKEALNCYNEALKSSPDDEMLKDRVIEIEKQIGKEHIVIGAEKTVEEALIEADIYLRYGLHKNAKDLLDAYRQKSPDNAEIHERLKSLYAEEGDRDQAIAECLILNELYKNSGDLRKSEQMIREAREINPDDERLTAFSAALHEEEISAQAPEGPSLDDYTEEIAEADFYARQGLIEEAREILERLQTLFPDNPEIAHKMASLGQVMEQGEAAQGDEMLTEPVISESEVFEAEELAEPAMDNDVMDIFNEFKKGLEKELSEEDYETHYNLGIAYKEMGLIDDAIREFQTSRNDPKRVIHASNMLGVCYIEKGLYPLAIEVLKGAIDKMTDRGEAYWAMKYELAEAYEKNGNVKEALDLYTQVYGWNAKFRAISDKIEQLKASIAEGPDKNKPKERKDRVSYL
jgi:pilus assembly protein FimV